MSTSVLSGDYRPAAMAAQLRREQAPRRAEQRARRLAEVAEVYRSDDTEARRLQADAMTPEQRELWVAGWNAAQAAAGQSKKMMGPGDSLPWSTARLHELALEEDGLRARVAAAERSVQHLREVGYARGALKPEPGTFWEHQEFALLGALHALETRQERV
jgi:hypothetical protein